MKDGRINVCYGISDKKGNYAKIMGTSICSVLENTKADVNIHILHDETLTEENRQMIRKMVSRYRQRVVLYDVGQDWRDIWQAINKTTSNPIYGEFRFTVGTFYRLLLGKLLGDEKRAIYLDADTIVNMDIKYLWGEKTSTSGLAAVSDIVLRNCGSEVTKRGLVAREEYFNAGVLLIDLDKFRSVDNIMGKSTDFIARYLPEAPDQDFLNYCFPHSAVLSEKYNCFVWRGREEGAPRQGYIYHYVNHLLGMDMDDSFNRLYFHYFVKTPWCNEEFLGNLAKKVEEVNYEGVNFANMCAGKKRIVIGSAAGKDVISQKFNLQERDLYIPFEEVEKVRLDFKKSKDVLLIFLPENNYSIMREMLHSYGLVENVNFFDMFTVMGISKKNNLGYKLFIDC